jgi:molybdopterin/thiamine biosynthesis adenylyltransferase/rhodanese-related sulfurtransferase
MPSYDEVLRELKSQLPEVDVATLAQELAGENRPVLIDVREADEHADGRIPGTPNIPRGRLEQRIERNVAERAASIVLYCESGKRSLFAARDLHALGYTNVRSLAGGYVGWKRAGLPWEKPSALGKDQLARYSRHTMLNEIGTAGQLKLLSSKVLCIGAGGLGSPSSMYLAAAGVGTLGIVDDDRVDASNLQRQLLHNTLRIGVPKVDSAEQTLRALNPDVTVVKHATRINAANALELIAPYDVIVDGADNFPTRYLLNDCALKLGKPIVHASIFQFEGQLTVFPAGGSPCYRCLFPEPPAPEDAPACGEAGVLGVLPGVLGVLQATEAIKVLLGIGDSLAARLLVYDALKARFRELRLARDPKCPTCGDGVDRTQIPLIDYEAFCAGKRRA